MTADPGDMVGLSERKLIEDELVDTWLEPDGLYFCDRIMHGTLYGQPVLLVQTGIGHDHASVCMSDLLRVFEGQLKDVFFLGTAGFSPRRGGILDPDSCGSDSALGGGASDDALVTLGDVCVSPWSTNWDCQRCVWSSQPSSGTVCRRPLCSMHGREDLFGELVCTFWGVHKSNALADEVYAAAATANLPRMSDTLLERVTRYWDTMGKGTGKDYVSAMRRTNRAFDYKVCSEVTSNTFWSGAPFDYLAREYVARLTNLGMRKFDDADTAHQEGGEPTTNVSALETIAVSAMEGTGWQAVLFMRQIYKRGDPIPFVNIRGAADYTHVPVGWDGGRFIDKLPLRRALSSSKPEALSESQPPPMENRTLLRTWPAWRENDEWLPHEGDMDSFLAAGYRHAIHTSSALVLHVFRLRAAAAPE